MNDADVLSAYFQEYEAPASFDPAHPAEPVCSRKQDGLPMKPMNAEQTVAAAALAEAGDCRALDLVLNNVESGTGEPARVKASFLQNVAVGKITVAGLSADDAMNHLYHMRGGHNIAVLVSLLEHPKQAMRAAALLSKSVLIHAAFDDVAKLYENGNKAAVALMKSWAKAEWFSLRKPPEDQTRVVVFKIPDDIEASTDFLSHSKGGHTRTDVPFHGKHYFMSPELLNELNALKQKHPDIPVAIAANVLGTSSSRKSGMNNVEWNTGVESEDTAFQPNKKTRAILFAGKTLGPIFAKTAQDMGSLIVRTDTGKLKTGDVVTVLWRKGAILNAVGDEIATFPALTQSDIDIWRAGGGTMFRMGKILTANARRLIGETGALPYEIPESPLEKRPMTAAQKVIARAAGTDCVQAGQTVYARVGTVASQDTTGPMTVQELQGTLAAMKLAVPLFLQSQCHNAAMGFRTDKVVAANSKLASFVRGVGGVALEMGDGIIHSWLNETVEPDSLVVGGDSHTRTPTALSFPLGSGGVAEAAATGVTEIVVPPSVLVEIKGEFNAGITVRDLVNFIPYKALKLFGKNIFEGTIIEYRRFGQPFAMIDVFKLTNSSAERSAAAAYFEQDAAVVADYVAKSSIPALKRLIAEGRDVGGALQKRVDALAAYVENPRKEKADDGASYAYTLEIDLAEIAEPYIACPHTPDNVKPLSELAGTPIGFGFAGSCMSGMDDFINFERITRPVAALPVEVWMAAPTKLIAERLDKLFVFKALKARGVRLEVSGCSLCMGNQERVTGERNVATTSTRNFKARMGDFVSVYLMSAELEACCAMFGRFPTVEDYMKAVKND